MPSLIAFRFVAVVVVILGSTPGWADGELLQLKGATGASIVRLLANLDDDDLDGLPDGLDDQVNGAADQDDLAVVTIEAADPGAAAVRVESDVAAVRCFVKGDRGWQLVASNELIPLTAGRGEVRVECRAFAAAPPTWNGQARLTFTAVDVAGEPLAQASLEVAVAAVELVAETRPVDEVYAARGRYDNEAYLAELRAVLDQCGVPLVIHEASTWQEMWMQDTMELATTAVPGPPGGPSSATPMTVVLAGLRDVDPFPRRLLAANVAVAEVAVPRGLGGGDAWVDWYGNLTVSPPTADWPRGRVIAGRNVVSGEGFHPEVIDFLAAQRVQPPIWIDTSWLLIKHVDEIVAFLPGEDGRAVMVVPDPLAGLELARQAGLEAAVGPQAAVFAETNRRIATAIDEMLLGGGESPRAGAFGDAAAGGGLLSLLGWDPQRIVRLPVAFSAGGALPAQGVGNAEALWSNPVNMLLVNGTVLCGKASMPEAVIAACRERFLAGGAERVVFLDDACYHRAKGNVHCSTAARRK